LICKGPPTVCLPVRFCLDCDDWPLPLVSIFGKPGWS
jgi:hypothetical protein